MKILRYYLGALLLVAAWSPLTAQIYVDADEDVGIGQTNTDNSKVRLLNTTNNRGFYLTADGSSTSELTGIFNEVTGTGTGAKVAFNNRVAQVAGSNQNATGLFNWTDNYGSGLSYSIANWIIGNGTGTKFGVYGHYVQNAAASEDILGISQRVRNYGTGQAYGTHTLISAEGGGGDKYGSLTQVFQPISSSKQAIGHHTTIWHKGAGNTMAYDALITADGRGTKYGFRSQVYENTAALSSAYGIHNTTYLYGPRPGYGLYNYVYDNTSSSNTKYGIYNYVQDATSGSNKYGIYNYLEKSGTGTNYALWSGVADGTDYAGYFSGNVVVTGTVVDGMSDGRLKEGTKDLVGALGMIAQLKPKSYRFKDNLGIQLPEGLQYGLIAQELETVMPDLVTDFSVPGQPIYERVAQPKAALPEAPTDLSLSKSEKDQLALAPTATELVESSQEIVGYEAEQSYKAINYRALIPVLVGAVQEQQSQIEEQQSQIQALQTEVQTLRATVQRLSK
ncbi:MAG: tail fiber domain-containing protein [Bacteroidota bacterium]